VNKSDFIEIFLGIQHVSNTTSPALNKALMEIFDKHGLLIERFDNVLHRARDIQKFSILVKKRKVELCHCLKLLDSDKALLSVRL
jgi:hypothetical protein